MAEFQRINPSNVVLDGGNPTPRTGATYRVADTLGVPSGTLTVWTGAEQTTIATTASVAFAKMTLATVTPSPANFGDETHYEGGLGATVTLNADNFDAGAGRTYLFNYSGAPLAVSMIDGSTLQWSGGISEDGAITNDAVAPFSPAKPLITIPHARKALLIWDADGWVRATLLGVEVTQAELDAHANDTENPHGVTAAQVGAEPAITAGTTAQYFRGDKTFQDLNKNTVGLGSVDDTSDNNKPVSAAQQTALDAKQDAARTALAGNTDLNGLLTEGRYRGDLTAGAVNAPNGIFAWALDVEYFGTANRFTQTYKSLGATTPALEYTRSTVDDGVTWSAWAKRLTSTDLVNDLTTGGTSAPLSAEQGKVLQDTKQATLVSGTNIKTVNGLSLLGAGDVPAVVTVTNTVTPTLTGAALITATTVLTTAAWGDQIPVDATGGDVHLVLPSAVGQSGAMRILRLDSSANNVWVHGFSQAGIGRIHMGATSVRIGSLGTLTIGIDADAPVVLGWDSPAEVSRLWTPADLAARAIDVDFSGLSTADGTDITAIANAGSLGGFYSSVVATEAPKLQTDARGLRLARFDGANDWMRSTVLADGATAMAHPLGAQFGLFSIVKLSEDHNDPQPIITNELTSNSLSYCLGGANSGQAVGFWSSALGWQTPPANWTAVSGTEAVVIGNYDQVNLVARVDGAVQSTAAKTVAAPTNTGASRIGRRWDGTLVAANLFAFDAYRIVGKAGAWTAAEIAFLEGYGMWLTGRALPGGHAYETAPPMVSLAVY